LEKALDDKNQKEKLDKTLGSNELLALSLWGNDKDGGDKRSDTSIIPAQSAQ
jgi:hypothetical protein